MMEAGSLKLIGQHISFRVHSENSVFMKLFVTFTIVLISMNYFCYPINFFLALMVICLHLSGEKVGMGQGAGPEAGS